MKYCPQCGGTLDDAYRCCPVCESSLEDYTPAAGQAERKPVAVKPQTIEELQRWYMARNLPSQEDTRFFIGEDYRGPRAFGIYRDGDNYIVYKNKNDGTRAVRYEGPDQAYAVNELFERLKQEILSQKGANAVVRTKKERLMEKLRSAAVLVVIVLLLSRCTASCSSSPANGYYRYNDDSWYCHDNSWYYYTDFYNTGVWDWYESGEPAWVDNSADYYYSSDYDSAYGASDISESEYYDSSWDDDSSYDWSDSDSWDSGSTDFDSDW